MKQVYLILLLVITFQIEAVIPAIQPSDIYFTRADTGYDLHIRKLAGIESILLTDSQRDPTFRKTTYSLRTEIFYQANGNELKVLDGEVLQTEYDTFFLIDSTPEIHPVIGESFYFFLPEKVIYGYSWTRQGIIRIAPGVRINLRLFSKKYGDHSGEFADQWIDLILSVNQTIYRPGISDDYKNIIDNIDNGELIVINEDGFRDLLDNIIPSKINTALSTDVVFIIDTTLSMSDEIPVLIREFSRLRSRIRAISPITKIGIIIYKDYGDFFVTRRMDLTDDTESQDYYIRNLHADGGGDVPEAVNEAICELDKMSFTAEQRLAFLIGDAPAHPRPRRSISRADAIQVINRNRIRFYAFALPF